MWKKVLMLSHSCHFFLLVVFPCHYCGWCYDKSRDEAIVADRMLENFWRRGNKKRLSRYWPHKNSLTLTMTEFLKLRISNNLQVYELNQEQCYMMTDEEWMRERKAVTNIVGQLPLSSVCLCTCHVSDTIIVYIKAESWVHRMSIFTASTERPIGILTMTTTHFPPPPPPFFFACCCLFILTGFNNFFFSVVSALS